MLAYGFFFFVISILANFTQVLPCFAMTHFYVAGSSMRVNNRPSDLNFNQGDNKKRGFVFSPCNSSKNNNF
jgi:hypothetical protein